MKTQTITPTRVAAVQADGVRLETLGGVYILRHDKTAAVVKSRRSRFGGRPTEYEQALKPSGIAKVNRQFTTALLAVFYMTSEKGAPK